MDQLNSGNGQPALAVATQAPNDARPVVRVPFGPEVPFGANVHFWRGLGRAPHVEEC
jgi:hypothetical protein